MNEVERAIELLSDDDLVWSSDFELIRHDLAELMINANQAIYPIVVDIALNLLKEGELNVREHDTTDNSPTMQGQNSCKSAGQERCRYSCCRNK